MAERLVDVLGQWQESLSKESGTPQRERRRSDMSECGRRVVSAVYRKARAIKSTLGPCSHSFYQLCIWARHRFSALDDAICLGHDGAGRKLKRCRLIEPFANRPRT